jgi:DNA-directed RNA polymerase specialized sigma24 family protein
VRQGIRVVRIGRENAYIDWRALVGGDAASRSQGSIDDFALAEEVVQDAWSRVLTYPERQWQDALLPAVTRPSS